MPMSTENIMHSCGFCGKELKIRSNLAGKKLRCTNCSLVFTAPTKSDDTTSAEIIETEVSNKNKKKKESPKEHRGVKILIFSVLSLLPPLFVNLYTIFFGKPTVARNDTDGAFLVTLFWLIMSLGVLVSIITIIITWLMANHDLKEMGKKRMDPDGYGLTKTGQIICLIVIVNLIINGVIKIFVGEKAEKQIASAKVVEKESQEPAPEVKIAYSPNNKNENNNPPRAEAENDKIYQDKYSLIIISYNSKTWKQKAQIAVENNLDMLFENTKTGSHISVANGTVNIDTKSWLIKVVEKIKTNNPNVTIKASNIIKINNRDSFLIKYYNPDDKTNCQMIGYSGNTGSVVIGGELNAEAKNSSIREFNDFFNNITYNNN